MMKQISLLLKLLVAIVTLAMVMTLPGCSAEVSRDTETAANVSSEASPDDEAATAAADAQRLFESVGRLGEERNQTGPGGQVAFSCTYCHGKHGDNQSDYYPRLAGLPARYTVNQLLAYREGQRDSLSMQSLALALTEEEIDLVAEFFESVEPALANVFQAEPAQVAAGRDKAAACIACHSGSGDPATPALDGQGYTYLVNQLIAYREGRRLDGGGVMPALTMALSDQDIEQIAHYFAAQ